MTQEVEGEEELPSRAHRHVLALSHVSGEGSQDHARREEEVGVKHDFTDEIEVLHQGPAGTNVQEVLDLLGNSGHELYLSVGAGCNHDDDHQADDHREGLSSCSDDAEEGVETAMHLGQVAVIFQILQKTKKMQHYFYGRSR